jgi:hypothetical protein
VQQSARGAWAVVADAEDADECGHSKKERPSFLKKRSKKLLNLRSAPAATRAPESKSFLVLFFKKELLS